MQSMQQGFGREDATRKSCTKAGSTAKNAEESSNNVPDVYAEYQKAVNAILVTAERFKHLGDVEEDNNSIIPSSEDNPLSARLSMSAFSLRMAHQIWLDVHNQHIAMHQENKFALEVKEAVKQVILTRSAMEQALSVQCPIHGVPEPDNNVPVSVENTQLCGTVRVTADDSLSSQDILSNTHV
jgi:hypothetical protein